MCASNNFQKDKMGENQFVCIKCKKLLNKKYMHANQMCADCFSEEYKPKPYSADDSETEKPLPSLNEMKAGLLDMEKTKLAKQYPDCDSWRAPQNFADSMSGVGYASELLRNYEHRLEAMSEKEIITLYKSRIRK